MIHEVLLALVGHPGDVIKREETGFYVSSGLPFLNPAEKVSVRAVVSRAEWRGNCAAVRTHRACSFLSDKHPL